MRGELMRAQVHRVRHWARRIVWTIGCLLLFGVALVAVLKLGGRLFSLWDTFPGFPGLHGLAAAAIAIAAGSGAVVLMVRLPRYRLVVGLALCAALRLLAVAAIDAPLVGDWASYDRIARSILEGGAWFSQVPTGFPIVLSLGYRLFGAEIWVAELLNVGFAVATGWVVYQLGARTFGAAAGGAALALYAVAPDQILLTPVVASDPLYTLLLAGALLAALSGGRRLGTAIAAGLLLGLSQYVRASTTFLVVAVTVWSLLVRVRLARVAVMLSVFLVVLVPVMRENLVRYGDLSISTSHYTAWFVLVGANQEHDGQYNLDDLALVGVPIGTEAGEERAMALAVERITSDPVGYALLWVRKFEVMWASGDYGVWTAIPEWPQDVRSTLALLGQVAWTAIVVLAALTVRRRPGNRYVLLVLSLLGVVAAAHTIIEVMPRYHFYMVPLFAVLAGAAAVRLVGSRPVAKADPAPAGLPAA